MSQHPPRDWKYLAEQASTEMDPAKLMDLIAELNRVLAERDRSIVMQTVPATDSSPVFVPALTAESGVSN